MRPFYLDPPWLVHNQIYSYQVSSAAVFKLYTQAKLENVTNIIPPLPTDLPAHKIQHGIIELHYSNNNMQIISKAVAKSEG